MPNFTENDLKNLIKDETNKRWNDKKIPFYLSELGKKISYENREDYNKIINGKLLDWAKSTYENEHTIKNDNIEFFKDDDVKEKVGFILSGKKEFFRKKNDKELYKHAPHLLKFVKELTFISKENLSSFNVPASVLVELMNKK